MRARGEEIVTKGSSNNGGRERPTEEDGDVAPASALFATKEDIHAKHARREGGNKRGRDGVDLFRPPFDVFVVVVRTDGRRVPLLRASSAARLKVKLGRETRIRGGRQCNATWRRRMTRERSWGMLEEREFSYLTTAEVH